MGEMVPPHPVFGFEMADTGLDGGAPSQVSLDRLRDAPFLAADIDLELVVRRRIGAANFHALRHTYASHAIMNGAPLFVVARNLGHSTTAMVEKHYGHLAPSYIADAIRAAAAKFGPVETNVEPLASHAGA